MRPADYAKDDARKPHHYDAAIGLNVKFRRTQLGYTQEKVAGDLGISYPQLQKYELGQNRLSGSRLVMIARILKCRVESFFEGVGEDSRLAKLLKIQPSEMDLKVIYAFNAIQCPSERTAILNLMRTMAGGDAD